MLIVKNLFFKRFPKALSLKALPKFYASNDSLTSQELKTQNIPVHLRPYDKNKYEVPTSKIKVHLIREMF